MAKAEKLLAAMRANPRGDWQIGDVETLARMHGIACKAPRRGSHYVLSHPRIAGHLTVPAHRPIKAIYIRLLLDMIESLAGQ